MDALRNLLMGRATYPTVIFLQLWKINMTVRWSAGPMEPMKIGYSASQSNMIPRLMMLKCGALHQLKLRDEPRSIFPILIKNGK